MTQIIPMSIAHSKAASAVFRLLCLVLLTLAQPGFAAGQTGWQAEWEQTVAAAKKEGQVTIYGAVSPMLIAHAGAFQKRFPEIKVVTVAAGSGRRALQRLMTERRAAKYLADLIMAGSSSPMALYEAKALVPIKPALILPEVIDQSNWWRGKHRYIDSEQKYIFSYMGDPQPGAIHYNEKLVNPKEITSFWDFLDPKWKGKIELGDVRRPGPARSNMHTYYYNPKLGPEFITRLLTEMDITLFRDRRQSVNWLATGKFPICFFCYTSEINKARAQGLPVNSFGFLKEGAGITSHSGTVAILDKAPHPNAVKVFINWLLSREGQITFQTVYVNANVGASNSLRIDIPKDMVPPDQRLTDEIDYVEVEVPGRMSPAPMIKLFNQLLATKDKNSR